MDALITIRMPGLAASRNSEREQRIGAQPVLPPVELTDEDLLLRIAKGNGEALASLFRRYAHIVRGLAYRVLHDSGEADDLLQDIFLLMPRFSASFDRSRGSARGWILQMTYKRAISRRRYLNTRHFYRRMDLDQADEQLRDAWAPAASEESFINRVCGNNKNVQHLLESLPENQQATLMLFFFDGCTFAEIAARLGQTQGNIRHHYYRGLENLRKLVFSTQQRITG